MPSIWDDPPDSNPMPPKGMLEAAYRWQQAEDRRRQEEQDELRALATRQRAEIAEFITAMRRLGISPRSYRCYYWKEWRQGGSLRRATKPARELIRGWHLGGWSSDEISHTDLPLKGQAIVTYRLITEAGELRSNVVDGRFGRTAPTPLPYVYHESTHVSFDVNPPNPNWLSESLRGTVGCIVRARGGA